MRRLCTYQVCHSELNTFMCWWFCFSTLGSFSFIYLCLIPSIIPQSQSAAQGHWVQRSCFFFVLKRPLSASDRLYHRKDCSEGSLWYFFFLNKHSRSCILTKKSQTLCLLWKAKSARAPCVKLSALSPPLIKSSNFMKKGHNSCKQTIRLYLMSPKVRRNGTQEVKGKPIQWHLLVWEK